MITRRLATTGIFSTLQALLKMSFRMKFFFREKNTFFSDFAIFPNLIFFAKALKFDFERHFCEIVPCYTPSTANFPRFPDFEKKPSFHAKAPNFVRI